MGMGKRARHVASIVNRPTCGGDKKVGLVPTVGRASVEHLQSSLNRGYTRIIWPVNCQQAKTGLDANGQVIMYPNRSGGWTATGRMPLSVNPQCSGGVGRSALSIGCGLWRW